MKSLLPALAFPLLLVLLCLPAGGCDSGGGSDEKVDPVDCAGATPHEFDGSCVACLEDDHCPAAQNCNIKTGNCACPGDQPHFDGEACLACVENKHCPDGFSCDQGANACLELVCPEGSPYLYNGSCVECVTNGHCPGELTCRPQNHSCGCADAAMKVVDDQCVECTKSTDCPAGKYCQDNLCVGEEQTGNCPQEAPYNYLGECHECLEDAHCSPGESCHVEKLYCIPPPLVCDPPTPYQYLGQCVQCLENAHCGAEEICNKSQKTCQDKPISGGECIFSGNGKNIGNQIGDFGAVDCDGNPINLHDYCGVAKAVWLINVAGWCGACDEYAPQANQMWQQYASQGLQLIFVLGEDPQGNPPSGAYCKQWAQSHQVTAPVMLDAGWKGLDSKIASGGYSLPWDYILDGDDMTFVWESVNWSSDALNGQIQKLLAD
jgi:hypothetical protein